MKSSFLIKFLSVFSAFSLLFSSTLASTLSVGTTSTTTSTTLSKDATELQADLDAKKDQLITYLDKKLVVIQSFYDDRAKGLVDTALFKAVQCLGFISSLSLPTDVSSLEKEYTTAILEEYVDISADIKRFSVGLISDSKDVKTDISSFNADFSQKLSLLDEDYQANYYKVKSDFDTYYSQNEALVDSLAAKIQMLDVIDTQFTKLMDLSDSLYVSLEKRTSVWSSVESLKDTTANLLKSDLDDAISRYQSLNPEVSFELMLAKRDLLVEEFSDEATAFLHIIFEKDFSYKDYLAVKKEATIFLDQFISSNGYQCGTIISSSVNWERSYSSLKTSLDTLIKGLELAIDRVDLWNETQIKGIDSALLAAFKNYYTTDFAKKKSVFSTYVMQLISEAYYQNQTQVEVPVTPEISWAPYTFTRTYTRGTYALELTYLQQFLTAQGLYTGPINGLYDALTIQAVLDFQLQEGILTGKESNKSAYGWMGPATRAKINEKMNP